MSSVPTKTQLSNFLGTPGEDYFKGNPKSLNFYFLVIWWGKSFMLNLVASNNILFNTIHVIISSGSPFFFVKSTVSYFGATSSCFQRSSLKLH